MPRQTRRSRRGGLRMSGVKRFVGNTYNATLGRAINYGSRGVRYIGNQGSRGLSYLGNRARSVRKRIKHHTGWRR